MAYVKNGFRLLLDFLLYLPESLIVIYNMINWGYRSHILHRMYIDLEHMHYIPN